MTITEHNLQTQTIPPRYNPVWFALEDADRQTLYDRIDQRVDQMISDGLLDEIQQLLKRGVPQNATSMQAIGYKEFLDVLLGNCKLEDAVSLVKQSSRHYAKRQLTWFRRNKSIHWLTRSNGEKTEEIVLRARQILADYDK